MSESRISIEHPVTQDSLTPVKTFDCTSLIQGRVGEAYCHEYDLYLNFFQMLALNDEPIRCDHIPRCWVPFILYLGHRVSHMTEVWDCDHLDWFNFYVRSKDKRRAVEISSTCRPELVHALYCADTEWHCPLRVKETDKKEFPVTCNGSFFRPEVQAYQKELQAFPSTRAKAVLVPCAASKPYPSKLHQAVLDLLPNYDWHVIVATGVLGLVPQELWIDMPHYDSGLPNLFRCTETVRWYFTKFKYDALVVYSDFYAHAIWQGLRDVYPQPNTHFVFGAHYRDRYENLLLPEHLRTLEAEIVRADR